MEVYIARAGINPHDPYLVYQMDIIAAGSLRDTYFSTKCDCYVENISLVVRVIVIPPQVQHYCYPPCVVLFCRKHPVPADRREGEAHVIIYHPRQRSRPVASQGGRITRYAYRPRTAGAASGLRHGIRGVVAGVQEGIPLEVRDSRVCDAEIALVGIRHTVINTRAVRRIVSEKCSTIRTTGEHP